MLIEFKLLRMRRNRKEKQRNNKQTKPPLHYYRLSPAGLRRGSSPLPALCLQNTQIEYLIFTKLEQSLMAHTALEYVKTYAASFASLFGTPHPPSYTSGASTSGQNAPTLPSEGVILLKPARRTGARLVLLPLLPPQSPKIDLPSELWGRCLRYAMDLSYEKTHVDEKSYARLLASRRDLMLVNKSFRVSYGYLY